MTKQQQFASSVHKNTALLAKGFLERVMLLEGYNSEDSPRIIVTLTVDNGLPFLLSRRLIMRHGRIMNSSAIMRSNTWWFLCALPLSSFARHLSRLAQRHFQLRNRKKKKLI
jgi:hypothetical protein